MKKKIILTIDGYSSSGKSTIAKYVSKKLNYTYINTGYMYRAITLIAIKNNFFKYICNTQYLKDKKKNVEKLIFFLKKNLFRFEIDKKYKNMNIFFKNYKIEKNIINSMEISNIVNYIANITDIREFLIKKQRKLGCQKKIVMDGRDIGSVVFPEAELKIFLTASLNTRVIRRLNQFKKNGENITYQDVLKNIKKRDAFDKKKKFYAILKKKNVIEIDNTKMTLKSQIQKIYNLALSKIKK